MSIESTRAGNFSARRLAALLMRRSPYASYAENLFDDFASNPKVAQAIRCADARVRLQELASAENSLCEREREIATISDSVQRGKLRHAFEMDCLIRFGCRADERATFCEILTRVAQCGGSTLSQAAALAKTICEQRTQLTEALGQTSGQSAALGDDAAVSAAIDGSV